MDTKTIKEILQRRLDAERLQHSFRVEEFALELASIYNIDKEKTRVAALLHDIARCFSREQMLSEAKKLNFTISQMEEIEPKLLHARLSRYLAENEFGVTDPVVLSAIEHHTLGRPNMSLLEKIIYLADHAECGRDYAEAQTIRELAKSNLDKALALSTAQTLKYLNARQSPIDQRTVETHKFYSKEK